MSLASSSRPRFSGASGRVYGLLGSGSHYRLANPGKEAEHDYGFVTGAMGFHEFVVINRRIATMHVIVASDD